MARRGQCLHFPPKKKSPIRSTIYCHNGPGDEGDKNRLVFLNCKSVKKDKSNNRIFGPVRANEVTTVEKLVLDPLQCDGKDGHVSKNKRPKGRTGPAEESNLVQRPRGMMTGLDIDRYENWAEI